MLYSLEHFPNSLDCKLLNDNNQKIKTKMMAKKALQNQIIINKLLQTNKLVYMKGKWITRSKKRCNRKKFTPEEDEKLKELVLSKKHKRWEDIAKEMPGRSVRQCRDRYTNYLMPGYFYGQWTAEEDRILESKFIEYGPQWSKITKFFSNRSSSSLKNRWNYYLAKNLHEKSEDDKTENDNINLDSFFNIGETYDEYEDFDDIKYEELNLNI